MQFNFLIFIYWAARLLSAIILLQTLVFKFGGNEESVYIFSVLGMEPWGRWIIGCLELGVAVLMLINATAWLGAMGGILLMGGALFVHFFVLGINVQGDGGYLFFLAWVILLCSLWMLYYNRDRVFYFLLNLKRK